MKALFSLSTLISVSSAADGDPAADISTMVVLSAAEFAAMGGAGIGLTSGAVGLYYTPAALAVRPIENTGFFYPTATASWLMVAPRGTVDMGNTGELRPGWSGYLINAAGGAHFGPTGAGIALQAFEVTEDGLRIDALVSRLGVARTLPGVPIAVGLSARVLSLDVSEDGSSASFLGIAPEVGVLWAEGRAGWNLGMALRGAIHARSKRVDLDLPIDSAVLPWQLGLGAGWASEASTRARPLRAWRFAADLVIDGAVSDAVGIYPLLEQELVGKGDSVTFSPRIGAEWEAWPARVRVRSGSYYEPSRLQRLGCAEPSYEESLCGARLHGTAGFELRLFHMKWLWGVIDHDITWETSIDVANRYLNVGWLGVGTWQTGVVGPVPGGE